ncbi:MAG: nuclear transport factor 2 family protein [Acidimicrobiales bacterium]
MAVIEKIFAAVGEGDVDEMARYWADDVVFEAPFSYTGTPSRTAGKQNLHERLSGSYGRVDFAFTVTETHEMADPDEWIVEYTSIGTMKETGQTYDNRYIALFRFRDGLLTLFREFYDSQKTAKAFG